MTSDAPEHIPGVKPPENRRARNHSASRRLAEPGARAQLPSGRTSTGEERWRRDIQGLRGVAILAVVIYHANPTLLRGGFAGVDVFYVISGFLITGLLIHELEDRGTISLRSFYARRIRRLLPMAFLVISATVISADLLQSPLDAARSAKDALASALYGANYRFAFQQTNYLSSGLSPSPFQHFWSLGVEEQMYALWPLLILAASGLWLRRHPSTKGPALILAVGSIASFVACIKLTHANEPWAFFSFPTRAWELGVGGLVAFAVPALRTLPRFVASVIGIAGIGAVAYSLVHFGATTPWPGVAAAVPVLGAAAIVAAGCARRQSVAAFALRIPVFQFAGQISYPWYLWHWPVLILAPYVMKHPLTTRDALALTGASGILATVSHYTVERPIQLSTWFTQQSRRGIALGFGLTAAAAALCATSLSVLVLPSANASSVRREPPRPAVAAINSASPLALLLATSTAQEQSAVDSSQSIEDVPLSLTPSLGGAYADEPVLYQDGCVDSYVATNLAPCAYGDTSATKSVVLFGDSHAAMWFPAVQAAALDSSWKLYAWSKDTCPPIDISVFSPDLGRDYLECSTWRSEVLAQIAAIHPALVILGVARHYSPIYGFTVYSSQWLEGLSEMVQTIRQMGPQVVVMGPIPKPPFSVPSCLSENLESATSCATPRGQGVDIPGMHAEESAVLSAGGSYVNTLFWFCSHLSVCPPIINGVLAYRDDNHITSTFAQSLSAPLEAALNLAAKGANAPGSAVLLSPDG